MRSRYLRYIVPLLSLVIAHGSFAAQADQFEVSLVIAKDGTVMVSERITYTGDGDWHGIFRDVPVDYEGNEGRKRSVSIDNIAVVDESGKPYRFEQSRHGNDLRLKIGDVNATIQGTHTYVITYRVDGALNFFDDHDEFYWNVTGNGWQVPIQESSADITLPATVSLDGLRLDCFVGYYGGRQRCSNASAVLQGGNETNSVAFSHGALAAREGLSVVVGFPKGLVRTTGALTGAARTVRGNGIVVLPVAVFAFMAWLWWTRGRDPKGRDIIVREYAPPKGLSPGETGTLVDSHANDRDVTAEIVHLAVKGFIKIERTQTKHLLSTTTDYTFHLLRNVMETENDFERYLLNAIFSTDVAPAQKKLSDLKGKFSKVWSEAKQKMYASLVTQGYFAANPAIIRTTFGVGGAIGVFLTFFFGSAFGTVAVISLCASFAIIVLFGMFMPKRTPEGVRVREHIMGFKDYIATAEKDRIAFHNAPESDPARFEKLLPFAIALGVEEKWAALFAHLAMQAPAWYVGMGGQFNMHAFGKELGDFSSNIGSNLSSAPKGGSGFGGGGFSGGGFGGGGGGHW